MKCPVCNNDMKNSFNFCGKCGLFAPGLEYFIDEESFTSWNDNVTYQISLSKKPAAIHTLKKSVNNSYDYYRDCNPGSVNNPIKLTIPGSKKYEWDNVRINESLNVKLRLCSDNVSEGELYYYKVKNNVYYFVLIQDHVKNKSAENKKTEIKKTAGVDNSKVPDENWKYKTYYLILSGNQPAYRNPFSSKGSYNNPITLTCNPNQLEHDCVWMTQIDGFMCRIVLPEGEYQKFRQYYSNINKRYYFFVIKIESED